jgi:hypothetical protein
MQKVRQRIPATGISGVAGVVSIIGGSVLGGVGAGWWWAIGFAVLVLTVGLALEYRRSRRAAIPTTPTDAGRQDRPGAVT